ncbi:MAG: molybdopterin-dependent oxidoreductase, partial [Pseudomonadota bacterium]
ARIVVIDPRYTPTAEDCDLFLQIAPGTDTILFSGLLVHLADHGATNEGFIKTGTEGFSAALMRAREIAPDIPSVARDCGLAQDDVHAFFEAYRMTEKTVTLYSQGVNQAAQGTDKVNTIINCHLATGRIGRPGMGPFSLTGQPNAMGGREVGGLANQLAAHMGFAGEDVDRVGRFWGAPRIAKKPGLKAVELFDAIGQGRIKALWVMATNPVVSLPRADAVREALRKLDLFVVSDSVASNDTLNARPDVVFPAAAWGEKDGTVPNSERRISRQRAVLSPPGEARPDWSIISGVAKRLGFGDAFDYRYPHEIFREHAALSAFENDGRRSFDIGALARLSPFDYQQLEPVQWPLREVAYRGQLRVFAKETFDTEDGRARFIAIEKPTPALSEPSAFPYRLNTGRVRDQWHTMTRTGKSPRLAGHIDEPFVDISRADAIAADIANGSLARITSPDGSAILRVRVSDSQRRGELFAPIHWSAQNASDARIGALVHAVCDPHSGQPDMKATQVNITSVHFPTHGILIARDKVSFPSDMWWARAASMGGATFRFAAHADLKTWPALAQRLMGTEHKLIEMSDEANGTYRAATMNDGKLQACLYLSSDVSDFPALTWLKQQLAADSVDQSQHKALLAGRPAGGASDVGPLVCACFGVGLSAIQALIANEEAVSVEEVGAHLKAGTNCGSCQPEIKKLIKANLEKRALAGVQV